MFEEQLIQYGALGLFCAYLVWQNKNLWSSMREEHEITREVINKNTLILGKISNAPCVGKKKQ